MASSELDLDLNKSCESKKERQSHDMSKVAKVLNSFHRRILNHRATVFKKRQELVVARMEIRRADEKFIKLIRERYMSSGGCEDTTMPKEHYIQLQAARDKYGLQEEAYNALEKQLDKDEYEITQLEEQLQSYCGSKDREVRIFEIPGLLAEHFTKALGDYGAKKNFIKEEYAIRLGLPINRDIVCKVTVGSGNTVTTTGAITALFRFKHGHDVYNLKFHLLPDCIHDVILGKSFLKLTETFSKLSNFCCRVKERVVKGISQFHLLYLGASSPMFDGSINGQPQTALADTGAKVLVMDEAYARSIGVSIRNEHEHRTRLKFADNSTADTSGMAYDIEWRFGRDGEFTLPYRLNFHILKNAPANVILCDTFLYDNEAFSRYHYYLVDNDDDYEDKDDESYCFAIDVDRRRRRMQTTAAVSSLADLQYLELVRRGEEEDRISTLPVDEQTVAQNIENQRCTEWDRAFAALRANSQAQGLQQPSATAISQLQSTQSAYSSTTGSQDFGSSPTSERLFLKWLTWPKRGQLTTGTIH